MVSFYEMFAAVVDLVVGTFEWITWPFIVISWPVRVALRSIFVWWSYLTKVIVYGVLDTVFWPFQVVAAARREKEVGFLTNVEFMNVQDRSIAWFPFFALQSATKRGHVLCMKDLAGLLRRTECTTSAEVAFMQYVGQHK